MHIQQNIFLTPYHTFGIHTTTAYFAEVRTLDELLEALSYAKDTQLSYQVLGKGSNVLFTKPFEGLLIQNHILTEPRIIKEDEKYVEVEVSSGYDWDDFVSYTTQKGWQGLENLSWIPGTVGAAPIQNIGAYGTEVSRHIVSIRYLHTQDGSVRTLSEEHCHFGYRESIFKHELKNKAIILYVCFRLLKKPYHCYELSYKELKEYFGGKAYTDISLEEIRRVIIQIRRKKLPDYQLLGNAGSFFKNPVLSLAAFEKLFQRFPNVQYYKESPHLVKLAAAWLIEEAGWKKRPKGKVFCYDKQALILVQNGEATGAEVLDFATAIQKSVQDIFGVHIDFEVNIW